MLFGEMNDIMQTRYKTPNTCGNLGQVRRDSGHPIFLRLLGRK
jgi:hypothetical protein